MILIKLAPGVIDTAKKIIPRNIEDANLNNISLKKTLNLGIKSRRI